LIKIKNNGMNKRFAIISTILFFIIIITEHIAYTAFNTAGVVIRENVEIVLIILGFVLPLIFIFSMLYSYKRYSLFNSLLNTISSVWLAFISGVFVVSIFVSFLVLINSHLDLNTPLRTVSNALLFIVIVITTYGILHSNKIKITRYNIKSKELSKDWSGKKIILVSDIHLGSIRHKKFLQKIVDTINKENPDITFNVGDMIDGSSIPYQKWFSPLSSLNTKLGNYYVEGNHERYSKEYDVFLSQFPKALNNLTDRRIILNNTQIIGLRHEDKETGEKTLLRLKSLGYDSDIPSIILIHDPRNTKSLSKNGVSLVLSGHTHAGQFFPFTVAIKKAYKKYAYGVAYTNNTASVTSSGVGSAIVPIRIGTRSEIVILTII